MRQKQLTPAGSAEEALKTIRRETRRHWSAEDKIRIVLEGLRGEESIAELCRHEEIAASQYYGWSKEFLEAGKRRLAGDTARAATSDEVKDLRREAQAREHAGTARIPRIGDHEDAARMQLAKARHARGKIRAGHARRRASCL